MINERLEFFRDNYEIVGGKKFMAPAPSPAHNSTLFELGLIIRLYMKTHDIEGKVFTDNVDLYLPDGTLFKPDLMVIVGENLKSIDWKKAIRGTPDMVVEVLSKSTKHRDLTIKKDIYESAGVKEYWIADPYMKCVDVYLLHDGKLVWDNEYQYYTEYEIEGLNEEEKTTVKHEVPVSIFPGLAVSLKDIFDW